MLQRVAGGVALTRRRVLQICHDYEGPFRAVCHLYAAAFEHADVTTVFVCGPASDDVARAVGGRVLFFEQPSSAMRGIKLGTLRRFVGVFRATDYDVVIAHRYKPIYFAGVMSWFFRIPVLLGVIHEHGVFRRLSRRLLVRLWCRNIVCVGVSESVSRDIERDCGDLRVRGRLYTLHPAIDPAAVELLPAVDARAKLGIAGDAFVFGTVGRLIDKKEHDVLIRAYAAFRQAHPDAVTRLVIMGSGPLAAMLRGLTEELGISDDVVFTGRVENAARYLQALDVFVLPSGDREAFGMVILEAMLARRPLISSDAPGPREVVGDTARLFPTGDHDELAACLAAIHASGAEARRGAGEAGFERLESAFTPGAFRRRLRALPPLRGLTEAL